MMHGMSTLILDYLRKLMKIADHADGKDDERVNKAKAVEYLNVLIGRADKLHCESEKQLLQQVVKAVQGIKKENFDSGESRWYAGEGRIEKELTKELSKTVEGQKLLAWKDVPNSCKSMDYSLPTKSKSLGHDR